MKTDDTLSLFDQVNRMSKAVNKIGNMNADDVLENITKDAREIIIDNESVCIDFDATMIPFIRKVKQERGGYVCQDIVNILQLGFSGELTEDTGFYLKTLTKWYHAYSSQDAAGKSYRGNRLGEVARSQRPRYDDDIQGDRYF